jgi:two-component system nitrogen regulation sensor histidine kinase GlnL
VTRLGSAGGGGPAGIWAALPIPALVTCENAIVTALNPAAEDFLNLSARSLTGHRLFDRLQIDAPMQEAMDRVQQNQSPFVINEVGLRTDQRAPVRCRLQLAPMPDHGFLLMMTPLEIADKLGHAAAARGAAKSAIGMAQMLAHEIKNPLAGISGAAQLLAMTLCPADRELSDLIVVEARRIVALLDQVEQFGNLLPPDRRAVNIHDALDRARRSARLGFGQGVTIHQDYDPSLPDTLADTDQLVQVFLNLIRNAAEAGARTIRLRSYYDHALRRRGKDGVGHPLALQVEIIDDGPGIPPAIAGNLFEPFVSGRENGTGLGLALVSKIIGEHEGWIAVEQAPGRTVFRVSLPLARQPGKGKG